MILVMVYAWCKSWLVKECETVKNENVSVLVLTHNLKVQF